MRCPKCRSEVGNQPVCPYCGGTVYIQGSSVGKNEDYFRTNTASPDQRAQGRRGNELRDIDRRLRNLETKVNLTLVLQTGTFALVVLTLVILALK